MKISKFFKEKKAISMSLRQIFQFLIMSFVLLFVFFSTQNLSDGALPWLKNDNLSNTAWNKAGLGKNSDSTDEISEIKNCNNKDCNDEEKQTWSTHLKKYDTFTSSDFYKNHHSTFENYAKKNNFDVEILYAILIQENGYSNSYKNSIRFECNKFNQYENQNKMPCTCSGTYCTKTGSKTYSTISSQTNYDAYIKAKQINSKNAFKATSFGFAQIMGFNLIEFGYDYTKGEKGFEDTNVQITYFFKFLENKNLIKHFQSKNWDKIAELYNGAGYSQTGYNVAIANYYETMNV